MVQPVIQIRPFRLEDKEQVDALFVAGMLTYKDQVSEELLEKLKPMLKGSLDDDLAKIEDVYKKPGGNFWVATTVDEQQEGSDRTEKVIGMVGLEAKPNQEGELRRMSVHSAYRRHGVGRLLVTHLETWAKANGFVKVWLTTGGVMKQACRFYEALGFEHSNTVVVDEDPHMVALYFTKIL
ncbi:Gcn5-related n-acetyltransferase-like protein, partial [Globisporangium splendens]